jgi:hypothetical protein
MPLRNGRDNTSHIFSTVDNSSYSVFNPAEKQFSFGDMIGPDLVLLFCILWFRNIFYSN